MQAHGNVHPMLRYIADAAPQKGEKAMRSGQQDPAAAREATGQEAAFQAASARLMGDAATAGDAPFGGEVQVDSQVNIKTLHAPNLPILSSPWRSSPPVCQRAAETELQPLTGHLQGLHHHTHNADKDQHLLSPQLCAVCLIGIADR